MGRFLVFFSYFGTRYRGLQSQPPVNPKGIPIQTVHGALESSLKCLKPANSLRLTMSSRTDKGVHALRNSCHVDLEHPEEGRKFHPEMITNIANYHLKKNDHDVRILETLPVNDNFHARFHARKRRYVYRLAHTKDPQKENVDQQHCDDWNTMAQELNKYGVKRSQYNRVLNGDNLPLTDSSRVRLYRTELDIEKLIQAAEVLSGIHNFSSFTRPPRDEPNTPHPVKMLEIGVKRGLPFGFQLHLAKERHFDHLEFWDIHINATSFLYRMVRRLVGTMILVAKNVISISHVQDVLLNPRTQYSFASLTGLEEYGLFLVDVEYSPEDLLLRNGCLSYSPLSYVPDEISRHSSH